MVYKNTPANLKLAKKMELAVKRYPGYTPIVDRTWNCGQDIRFEIGTCCALQIPFTVSTYCTDTGYFEIKLRMRKDQFDSIEMLELKHWLEVLEPLTALLKEYIAEAKPQRATYVM